MKIFLAGGGNVEESRLLDQRFVEQLDQTKPLIYIPNAMKEERYSGCLEWFSSLASGLGITNFRMVTDLERYIEENPPCSGIYMGGGNTPRLLSHIRNSGFDAYLKGALSSGIPIYGGSAGAIVLGQTILTAPESDGSRREDTLGMDTLNGFSVVCHYDGKEDMRPLCRELNTKIIAIPERSGIYIEDGNFEIIGHDPVLFFEKERKILMDPENTGRIDKLSE